MGRKQNWTDEWASETELACQVVSHFTREGYEVYQEVIADHGTADIVATRSGNIIVVECKLHLTLHLMEQAYRWRAYADSVYMAFPGHYPRNLRDRLFPYAMTDQVYPDGYSFACHLAQQDGVGHILVGRKEVRVYDGERRSTASLRDRLLSKLHPLQQNMAKAGSNRGERYTPFKITRNAVIEYVKKNPGCGIKEIIGNVAHHYCNKNTFRSSFVALISRGVIPEIRMTSVGGQYRFLPVTQSATPNTVSGREESCS